MKEEFDYDAYGRLLTRRAFRDAVLEGEITFAWYQGHVTQSNDSVRNQDTQYFYDSAGRVRLLTYSRVGESVEFGYDLRSREISETYSIPSTPSPVVLEL